MNVSKKTLKKLVKKPYLIGTRDRYIQEGIKYLAEHLLENDGKIILKWEN